MPGVFAETIAAAGPAAPWITMVHGASQDRRVFSAQVPAFEEDHRLLLVDLPGHGRSGAWPGPYGLEEYADGVLAAMDDAGVTATHFWGTHTGAGVGLLLASRHPDRLTALVLEGAVIPGVVMPSVARELERVQAEVRAHGIEAARREWFAAAWFDVIRAHPHRCRAAAHWAMISEFAGGPWLDPTPGRPVTPITERLAAIKLPVLLINGEHDLDDFVQVADDLERALPRAARIAIPEAGGFPLWEFPDRVNVRVREFLDRVR